MDGGGGGGVGGKEKGCRVVGTGKGGGFREEGLEGEKSLLLALSLPGKKEEKGEENWKPRALGFPTGQRG